MHDIYKSHIYDVYKSLLIFLHCRCVGLATAVPHKLHSTRVYYTYIHTYTYICIYIHMHIYILMYIHVYVRMYIYIYNQPGACVLYHISCLNHSDSPANVPECVFLSTCIYRYLIIYMNIHNMSPVRMCIVLYFKCKSLWISFRCAWVCIHIYIYIYTYIWSYTCKYIQYMYVYIVQTHLYIYIYI